VTTVVVRCGVLRRGQPCRRTLATVTRDSDGRWRVDAVAPRGKEVTPGSEGVLLSCPSHRSTVQVSYERLAEALGAGERELLVRREPKDLF
jgi:hypothetical protein